MVRNIFAEIPNSVFLFHYMKNNPGPMQKTWLVYHFDRNKTAF